jgi:hypothetical protein
VTDRLSKNNAAFKMIGTDSIVMAVCTNRMGSIRSI